LVVGRATWSVYQKERVTRHKLGSSQEEYSELTQRQEFLESEIERLGTPEGVEEEIRERFGFAKEGERVIVLVESDQSGASAGGSGSGFWSWLKGLFGRD